MILNLTKSEFEKESFWAFDTTSVVDRIQIWKHTLPRIEVFYATKCNPDFEICKRLSRWTVDSMLLAFKK